MGPNDLPLERVLLDRGRQVQAVARWFAYDHLSGLARAASQPFAAFVVGMLSARAPAPQPAPGEPPVPDDQRPLLLPDSPELVKALDELLAAKDWCVRTAIADQLDDDQADGEPTAAAAWADVEREWTPPAGHTNTMREAMDGPERPRGGWT